MVPWSSLAESHPELAQRGRGRLFEFAGGLAFLSTPQAEGEPRVQPARPIIFDGRLYVSRAPTTFVGRRDLVQRETYALQAFPLAGDRAGDFYLTGEAVLVGKPRRRLEIATELCRRGRLDDVIYELLIGWALYAGWERSPESAPRAVRLQWHAEGSGSSGG